MRRVILLLASALAVPSLAQAGDVYDAMLGYLTTSHLEGQVLRQASGSIKVNQASGDLNLQLNSHGLATGPRADTDLTALQSQGGNHATAPDQATVVLGGQVLQGGSGVASINQASGAANAQRNLVGVAQAPQSASLAVTSGSAELLPLPSVQTGRTVVPPTLQRLRRVEAAASALKGFEGVLQLNQIAGSANVAENRLGLLVQTGP